MSDAASDFTRSKRTVEAMRIGHGFANTGHPPLVACCATHSTAPGAAGTLNTPERRINRGKPLLPTFDKVIDDLAKHAVAEHTHPRGLRDELTMRGLINGKTDQLWWWRGYLTAHLANDYPNAARPQWSNAGGAANRLKRQWKVGYEVGAAERAQLEQTECLGAMQSAADASGSSLAAVALDDQ